MGLFWVGVVFFGRGVLVFKSFVYDIACHPVFWYSKGDISSTKYVKWNEKNLRKSNFANMFLKQNFKQKGEG